MDIDLITLQLKLALREPGCPLCRLYHQAADRYIRNLLWEHVNDGETRLHFVRSLGFCPTHAWQLQQTEIATQGDGLGTAILVEDLTRRILMELETALGDMKRDTVRPSMSMWRRWWRPLRHWWEQRLARSARTSASSGAPGLWPRGRCRVCELSQNSEATYLEWLVRGCMQAEFQEWVRASDGLCLAHLRRALALAGPERAQAAHFLMRITYEKLTRLDRELQEYIRKRAWEYRYEPKLPSEQSAWIRTVAFFAGEKPEVIGVERTPCP